MFINDEFSVCSIETQPENEPHGLLDVSQRYVH